MPHLLRFARRFGRLTGPCLALTILVMSLLSLQSPAALAAPAQACEGDLAPRLVIGGHGQVTPRGGLNLRAEASRRGKVLAELLPGTTFAVIAGPICADRITWWQIQVGETTGWSAETVERRYALMPLTEVDFEGVRFAYNPTMAPDDSMRAEARPPINGPDDATWELMPDSLRFDFDPTSGRSAYATRLQVFPRRAYGLMNPNVAEELRELDALLKAKRPIETDESLPDIGSRGSAQLIAAAPQYIETETLIGIRYVAAYAQMQAPITRNSVSYIFQGFTRDGAYFVRFRFPIKAYMLPEQADEQEMADWNRDESGRLYREYRNRVVRTLSGWRPDGFGPSLLSLDGMFGTMRIGEGTLAATVANPTRYGRYSGDISPAQPRAACTGTSLPSRLAVGDVASQILPSPYLIGMYRAPGGGALGFNVSGGELLVLMDGPVCVDGTDYWLALLPKFGRAGWVQEAGYFHKEEKDVYYVEPVPNLKDTYALPKAPAGQQPAPCKLIPLDLGRWSAAADAFSEAEGRFLIGGATYYADALLRREDGGYMWWRLTPGATVRRLRDNGRERLDTPIWVRTEAVDESAECLNTPVIADAE